MSTLSAWLERCRAEVDSGLGAVVSETWPETFATPLAYPLQTGGKRIRPALCHAAAQAVLGREDFAIAKSPALAIELVHTYSLVHDDLPAMDNDDERRGKPTVHIAFDEATAILVGDALLTEAFAVACRDLPAEAGVRTVTALARAAGHHGMIGGQVADITGGVEDVDTLVRLHAGKTGALIAFATWSGGLAALAHQGGDLDDPVLGQLRRFGELVGLAFQLADDVLDAEEDAGDDGPPSFCKLLGVAETSRRARAYADEAIALVDGLADPTMLVALARFSVERDH
ncbi:MAG: polyprenyl synthetase family protein [Deltaproteobacteria bacterium]|nr:MAG: polyprenyl synthetase family protein [Deltaproteobacteria bacterium]